MLHISLLSVCSIIDSAGARSQLEGRKKDGSIIKNDVTCYDIDTAESSSLLSR